MTRPALIGSGYNPSAWCPCCQGVYPIGGVCECQAERSGLQKRADFINALLSAASIRRNTFTLLRELYGPRCRDCAEPATFHICPPCLEWRLR